MNSGGIPQILSKASALLLLFHWVATFPAWASPTDETCIQYYIRLTNSAPLRTGDPISFKGDQTIVGQFSSSDGKLRSEPIVDQKIYYPAIFVGTTKSGSRELVLFIDEKNILHKVPLAHVTSEVDWANSARKVPEICKQAGPNCMPHQVHHLFRLLTLHPNNKGWAKSIRWEGLFEELDSALSVNADHIIANIIRVVVQPEQDPVLAAMESQVIRRGEILDKYRIHSKQTNDIQELLGHLKTGPALIDYWATSSKASKSFEFNADQTWDITRKEMPDPVFRDQILKFRQMATQHPDSLSLSESDRTIFFEQTNGHSVLALGIVGKGKFKDQVIIADSHAGAIYLLPPEAIRDSMQYVVLVTPLTKHQDP